MNTAREINLKELDNALRWLRAAIKRVESAKAKLVESVI